MIIIIALLQFVCYYNYSINFFMLFKKMKQYYYRLLTKFTDTYPVKSITKSSANSYNEFCGGLIDVDEKHNTIQALLVYKKAL